MASDWIKWVKGLSRRREVLAIAKALKIDRRIVACGCMELWEWADENTTCGKVKSMSVEDIDTVIMVDGFGAAMADVGWVRPVNGDGIEFSRWDRHNTASAKRRSLDAERKSKNRPQNVRENSASKAEKKRTREEREREREKRRDSPSEGEEHSRGKCAGHDSRSDSPASPDPPRASARMHWLAAVDPLFSKESKQRLSDKTSSERMFDELIWEEDADTPRAADRYRKALALVKRSSGRANRMAWITKVINEELA
jgi:hypothetical protein